MKTLLILLLSAFTQDIQTKLIYENKVGTVIMAGMTETKGRYILSLFFRNPTVFKCAHMSIDKDDPLIIRFKNGKKIVAYPIARREIKNDHVIPGYYLSKSDMFLLGSNQIKWLKITMTAQGKNDNSKRTGKYKVKSLKEEANCILYKADFTR